MCIYLALDLSLFLGNLCRTPGCFNASNREGEKAFFSKGGSASGREEPDSTGLVFERQCLVSERKSLKAKLKNGLAGGLLCS